jgi:drug/metabolite transporter (DMT)-like permease
VPQLSKNALTWISLWTVYLIWGSTYFAIAYVIESMPPLLAMGIRFLIAGLLLASIVSLRQGVGELRIPRAELRS